MHSIVKILSFETADLSTNNHINLMRQSGDEEMFLMNSWCEERHGIYTEVSEACPLKSNHRDTAVSFRVNFDGFLPMLLTFLYGCF